MRAPILGLAIAGSWGLTGCGDSPTCESALRSAATRLDESERAAVDGLTFICNEEKWSGGVRTCVSKAKGLDEIGGCVEAGEARRGNFRKAKRSEAELNLDAIGKAAKVHYVTNDGFPKGSAPLTPATSCCEHAPSRRCPATASDWQGVEVWDRLDFDITDDHFFRYSYESDGVTFIARAVGDLDCDMTEATYELRGEVVNGSPRTTLVKPPRPD